MLRTKAVEERLRRGRIEAKTRDAMFRAKIEVGARERCQEPFNHDSE